MLSEYTEVLTRSKFNFDYWLVNDFLEFIKNNGEYIVAESQNIKFIDEEDKIFYDVFKTSKAEYIITGNIKHYPQEKNIILPKDFNKINLFPKESRFPKPGTMRRKFSF
jgi:predicted nucleic acid-binding protein